jgi:precorrin-6B methylase 2
MPGKQWSRERLRTESNYWHSYILLTAAHLDLFAWIGNRERNARAFAAHFGGNSAAWEIFLNALCGMGLLHKRRRNYTNTLFAARHLNHGAAAWLLPNYDGLRKWTSLVPALIVGKRPTIHIPFSSNRSQAKRLLDGLDVDGKKIAPYLIDKLPLKGSGSLLDVGGGLGTYSLAFCRCYPRLQATIIEQPKIVPLARRAIRAAGMAQRIRVIGVDIVRQPLPQGFDTVFASNILHSQGVAENRSLLLKIRNCLEPKGQLILRDVFMSRDRTAPEWGALFSVLLLLHTPAGRCYALDEVLGWLREAGFSRVRGPFRSSPLSFDPDSVVIATT